MKDSEAYQGQASSSQLAVPAKQPAAWERWIMLSALCLGLVYQLLLPPWMGEDEPWQLEMIHWVARGYMPGSGPAYDKSDAEEHDLSALQIVRRFPGLSLEDAKAYEAEVLASMRRSGFEARVDFDPRHPAPTSFDQIQDAHSAASQQPLYHVLVGLLLRPFGELDPLTELRLVRALSLLTYLGVVWFAILLAREAFRDFHGRAMAVMVVAWMPMHARQAAVVNNDVLVKLFTAAAIALTARWVVGRGSVKERVLLVLCLALGLATKTTGMGALGAVGLALFLRRGISSNLKSRLPWSLGLMAIAGLALVYFLSFHSPALPKNVDAFLLRVGKGLSPSALLALWGSTVGVTNWNTRLMPDAAYWSVGFVAALSFVGVAKALLKPPAWMSRPVLVLCTGAIAIQFALLVLRGVAVGRYWMPVLPAWGVLVAAGLLVLFSRPPRRFVLGVFAVLLVVYHGWFLWGALVVQEHMALGN